MFSKRIGNVLITSLLALLLFSACSGASEQQQAWQHIRAGALLIDVRTPQEFASGHLNGAINIPHDQIAARIGEVNQDKGDSIVLYCRSGNRSGIATNTLASMGYTKVINGGGYEAMKSAE